MATKARTAGTATLWIAPQGQAGRNAPAAAPELVQLLSGGGAVAQRMKDCHKLAVCLAVHLRSSERETMWQERRGAEESPHPGPGKKCRLALKRCMLQMAGCQRQRWPQRARPHTFFSMATSSPRDVHALVWKHRPRLHTAAPLRTCRAVSLPFLHAAVAARRS